MKSTASEPGLTILLLFRNFLNEPVRKRLQDSMRQAIRLRCSLWKLLRSYEVTQTVIQNGL